VADCVDLFAPVVLADLRASGDLAISWPRSVAIDSFSLRTRLWEDGLADIGGRDAGEIYVANRGSVLKMPLIPTGRGGSAPFRVQLRSLPSL
jgi:hypothetical protein